MDPTTNSASGIKLLKKVLKNIVIKITPLHTRKNAACWVGRQRWLSKSTRYWWAQELVRDLKRVDINQYHKFLWENHLAYAESYNTESRYGYDNIKDSRKVLFEDLETYFKQNGINRQADIDSVLEVGCSLGYLLQYMEDQYFPSAKQFIGIDIDKQAISEGKKHLEQIGSRVQLKLTDMETLHHEIGDTQFDIIFCLGVLMYLREENARMVVKYMLKHTRKLLVLSGLAHPITDNQYLIKADTRSRDMTFIHNIDEMVINAGGRILFRRWDGDKLLDNNSIYFIFAQPG